IFGWIQRRNINQNSIFLRDYRLLVNRARSAGALAFAFDELEGLGFAEVDEVVGDGVAVGELGEVGDEALELIGGDGGPEGVAGAALADVEVEEAFEGGGGAASGDLAEQAAEVGAVGADAAADVDEVLRGGAAGEL